MLQERQVAMRIKLILLFLINLMIDATITHARSQPTASEIFELKISCQKLAQDFGNDLVKKSNQNYDLIVKSIVDISSARCIATIDELPHIPHNGNAYRYLYDVQAKILLAWERSEEKQVVGSITDPHYNEKYRDVELKYDGDTTEEQVVKNYFEKSMQKHKINITQNLTEIFQLRVRCQELAEEVSLWKFTKEKEITIISNYNPKDISCYFTSAFDGIGQIYSSGIKTKEFGIQLRDAFTNDVLAYKDTYFFENGSTKTYGQIFDETFKGNEFDQTEIDTYIKNLMYNN